MKKRTIYITLFLIFIIGVISLIGTFAIDSSITEGNSTKADYLFNITLGDRTNREIVIPSYDSKIVDIKISNPNEFNMSYLLYLEGVNSNISIINISNNEASGVLNSKTNTLIKVFIQNNSGSDITTSIKDIVGFESEKLSVPSNNTSINKGTYYKVIVKSNDNTYGKVKPNIKLSTSGGTVKYTLVPNTGYQYKSTTCNGAVSNNILTISNITSNTTCEVVFEPKQITVNFDLAGGGIETTYTEPKEHIYTVPYNGTYKLETWGAQGGTAVDNCNGGYGGYSVGTIGLSKNSKLYVNVGGSGTCNLSSSSKGGYNGGGDALSRDSYRMCSGGGATHISTTSGLLKLLSDSTDSILIVSGAGGGSGAIESNCNSKGGSGGGISGTVPQNNCSDCGTRTGGTQTSGGSSRFGTGGFGYGAGSSSTYSVGGGAGFYGGSGDTYEWGATGGSGYIGNSLLTNKYMYCYNCETSDATDTKTYTTTNTSSTPISNYAKSGNGAAKITLVDNANYKVTYNTKYSSLPTPTRSGYTFMGWYTGENGTGTKITDDTVLTNENNHTLYAYFTINTYYITYDANGGTGAPDTQAFIFNSGSKISTVVPTRPNYTFVNWTYQGVVFNPGDAIPTGWGSFTLTANWNANPITISFDVAGGYSTAVYTNPQEYAYAVPYAGTYKLETWGAQGGSVTYSGSTYRGGYGGYSTGLVYLTPGAILYVNVGGMGASSSTDGTRAVAGGYNGGGYAYQKETRGLRAAGGGGATHISTSKGILSTLGYAINSILIVSGGGAGGYCYDGNNNWWLGNSGGGYIGGYSFLPSAAGTQSGGFSFGQASDTQYSTDTTTNHSGGGGGYYGGYAYWGENGAGGGSGYIGNSALSDKYMYCYGCATSNETATKTYVTTNVSDSPISNYAKIGNGAAAISLVYIASYTVPYGQSYGTLPTPSRYGYVFDGWYTGENGTGTKITSNSIVSIGYNHTLYANWTIADTSAPTCSLSANASTISASASYNVGIAYQGWSSSYSGGNEYSKGISVGTHTYYVKDTAGNTNTCSISISGQSETSVPYTETCAAYANYTTVYSGSCRCSKKATGGTSYVEGYCNPSSGCSCPGGTSISSNSCIGTKKVTSYYCPGNGTVSGSTCIYTKYKTVYGCPSGYTGISGSSLCYKY